MGLHILNLSRHDKLSRDNYTLFISGDKRWSSFVAKCPTSLNNVFSVNFARLSRVKRSPSRGFSSPWSTMTSQNWREPSQDRQTHPTRAVLTSWRSRSPTLTPSTRPRFDLWRKFGIPTSPVWLGPFAWTSSKISGPRQWLCVQFCYPFRLDLYMHWSIVFLGPEYL